MHRFPQIASPLHIEPEIRTATEYASENECRCRGHVATIVAQFIDVLALRAHGFMAIRDHLGVNIEIRPEDLMDAPEFSARGGIVRARAMFGARLPALLDELTDTLVA